MSSDKDVPSLLSSSSHYKTKHETQSRKYAWDCADPKAWSLHAGPLLRAEPEPQSGLPVCL